MKFTTNWTNFKKIGFRFVFIFLSLEILTENFIGIILINSSFFFELLNKIYLKPLLWLNNHFFQFPYSPKEWNSISGSLIVVRHFVFFIFAASVSLIWTLIDRKTSNYKPLNFWFSEVLKIMLSIKVFSYGIIKVFPVQMDMPSFIDLNKIVGELSPVNLLWNTIGFGQPYQIFLGIAEVAVAILILFRKTMVIGLLLLTPIILNVVMMNYTYVIGILDITLLLLLMNIYLLIPFIKSIYLFFLQGENAVLKYESFTISKKWLRYTVSIIAISVVLFSFSSKTITSYKLYNKLKLINSSRKYSEVKSFVLGKDTLRGSLKDTICWRFWSEKIVNSKHLLTITMTNPNYSNTYELAKDTINHILTLNPLIIKPSKLIKLKYEVLDDKNWHMEGQINGKNYFVDFKKIIPEENLKLLKTKRNFLNLDVN